MAFQGVNPICFESVSAVTATPTVDLGTRRTEAGEDYVYVYAVSTVSASVGCSITGVSGYSVIATGVVSGQFCMGFAKHAAIPAGSYGWLLQRGFVDSVKNAQVGTAITAGAVLALGADGWVAMAADAATVPHVIGRALTATVSGGTGASTTLKMFLNVV